MQTSQHVRIETVRWRILPVETPRVFRYCPHCGTTRPFASSDAFRLNAHQRKVDVWLIYRCVDCDCTWNCTIFTHTTPEEIGPVLYRQFQENHRETAWRYAFDLRRLQCLGVRFEATVPIHIERTAPIGLWTRGNKQTILLDVPYSCEVRLDKLLARELHVSRSDLQCWFDQGRLHIWPMTKDALRKSIKDGQMITLEIT